MGTIRKKKILLDVVILISVWLWVLTSWYTEQSNAVIQISMIAALLVSGLLLIDLSRLSGSRRINEEATQQEAAGMAPHQLILLNEEEKPIRAWDLTGKTAMIIGRKHRDAEVDVDLNDCEYSALINVQHAVLNFSLDTWYLEDLGSQNGIRIKKVEDGICYQVTQSRPCKISAGDVIYIAKTKLLFT